jgi:predicted DNA binding protein
LIEALLSLRIPGLWVTPVSENINLDITCRVGGQQKGKGWGVVTLRGKDWEIDEAIEFIRNHESVGEVTIQSRRLKEASIIVDVIHCPACEVLITSKAFLVFPVEIRDGWMKWLLITENETVGEVINGLKELKIDVNLDRLTYLGGKGILTDRQQDLIRVAFEAGYFDFPRRIDSSDLAKKLGISGSTLSEILRAAERRVFSEYLRA